MTTIPFAFPFARVIIPIAKGTPRPRVKSTRPAMCHVQDDGPSVGPVVEPEPEPSTAVTYTRIPHYAWRPDDLARLPEELRPLPAETLDLILRKRVFLLQARRGYRANTDSQVLAYAATRSIGWGQGRNLHLLDLGCGNGLVSILMGQAHRDMFLHMVELQSSLCNRARRNIKLNGLADRASILECDIARPLPAALSSTMDVVLCNPPFYPPDAGRSRPRAREKQLAWFESSASLLRFCCTARDALSTHGLRRIFFIFPYDDCARLHEALDGAGLHLVAIQEVNHKPHDPPARVVLEAAPIPSQHGLVPITLPPLCLHPHGIENTYGHDMEDFLASLPIPTWRIGNLRDLQHGEERHGVDVG